MATAPRTVPDTARLVIGIRMEVEIILMMRPYSRLFIPGRQACTSYLTAYQVLIECQPEIVFLCIQHRTRGWTAGIVDQDMNRLFFYMVFDQLFLPLPVY